ncbi:hypothetical protein ACFSMW_16170 [Virgibacillus halophilus]|uniref:hypothetical protein n=1 Tax=Tigheibacillus halophilus TaxID=361280 RepID=UPI00363395C2
MFSFQTFKNKRYWILLLPFVMAIVLIYHFVPNQYGLIQVFILIAAFWIIFHIWNFYSGKKSHHDNVE